LTTPLTTSFGGVSFPLADQTTAADLLPVADPALSDLLAFVRFFLNVDMGSALVDALENASPTVTQNVMAAYSTDPGIDSISPEQVQTPALFIWRKSSSYAEAMMNQPRRVSICGWLYILPPMRFEFAEKYSHICNAVELSLGRAITYGYHPAYNGGAPLQSGITGMRLLSASREVHPGGELTSFYAVGGEIEMTEDVAESLGEFGEFDAIDFDIGVGNASDVLPSVIQADSSVPIEEG
jgi:hypothetical protein